ncbi:MAG: phosphate/phosphite/phosphonate ABC transporter substrate-binding protein [Gammaproteobacteria bacterium]|jgi:phosphonate transport system substrate-binding protein|nr:phosphate/phosphite/phosphonate ABC transporter substrate-binding protein [Gammaproteobacteria bacterium]
MQIIRITFFFVLMAPALAIASGFVFSVPPAVRDEPAVYEPLRDHLARTLGEPVHLQSARDWSDYAKALKKAPELVFGPPHVIAWLTAWYRYQPLARLPGSLRFVTFIRRHHQQILQFSEIGGRRVCGEAPPGLGGATLISDFAAAGRAPLRSPRVLDTPEPRAVLQGVLRSRCDAGLLSTGDYQRLGGDGATRVIHQSQALPHYAFAASGLLEREQLERLRAALLSAPEATRSLRESYGVRGALRNTGPAAFAGLEDLLSGQWQFRLP